VDEVFIHLPVKIELIEGSETSAISTVTPGNYPKENILHNYMLLCTAYSYITGRRLATCYYEHDNVSSGLKMAHTC